jgi:hypothetical protein
MVSMLDNWEQMMLLASANGVVHAMTTRSKY